MLILRSIIVAGLIPCAKRKRFTALGSKGGGTGWAGRAIAPSKYL